MADARQFWDKRAVKYAASQIDDEAAYTHTLDRVRVHLTSTSKVLELGCGTGTTAVSLAPSVETYLGTDISGEMIRIAREKGKGLDALTFADMGALKSIDAGDQPDVVLAFNLLHLLPNAHVVVDAVHERLDAGGVFISKTPCIAEPSIGAKRFVYAALVPLLRLFGIAPFVNSLTFVRLEKMVTDAGFEIIEAGSFPAMSRYLVARKN